MKRIAVRLALSFFFLTLSSCGSSVSLEGGAFLRVVHAVPGVGLLDVFLDGGRIVSGLNFASTSLYRDVVDGTQDLTVRAAGNVQTLFTSSVALRFSEHTTAILFPRGQTMQLITLQDLDVDPPSGKASLRIVNGISDVPLVDVYVTAPGVSIENQTPAFRRIEFLEVIPYVTFDQGFSRIRFTTANTKNVILDSGTLSFETERNVTAVAIESSGGGASYQFILNNDNP